MEMTCWGCIIFRKLGGNLHIKHVIVLSSIIEHSTLVSNLLYKEATKQIEDFDSVTEIIAWSDCGPHYKSYDHCAGWTGDFVEAPPNRTVLLCFLEKSMGRGRLMVFLEKWKIGSAISSQRKDCHCGWDGKSSPFLCKPG